MICLNLRRLKSINGSFVNCWYKILGRTKKGPEKNQISIKTDQQKIVQCNLFNLVKIIS